MKQPVQMTVLESSLKGTTGIAVLGKVQLSDISESQNYTIFCIGRDPAES